MNILIIIADDLGWGDVGFNGGIIPTPTIDELANQGIVLKKFYANSICTPTRASLLTGRFAHRYGLQQIIWPWNEKGLSLKEILLPQILKFNGYMTYCVGKWNLGHYSPKFWPTARGFHYHYGSYTGSTSHFEHKYHNVHDFHENGKPIYPKGHLCDLHTDKAIEIIQKNDSQKPFFLYLAFNSPHLPLEPKKEWFEKMKHIRDPTKRKYAALVAHMDDNIKKIINALKEKNLYEDTLIWFMSDNGGWVEKGCGGNNGKLKGGKISFYEGGIKVVSLIKWKNYIKNLEETIHVTDVLPTLCSLIDVKNLTNNIDGIDATKIIFEKENTPTRNLIFNIQKYNNNFYGCLIKDNLKLIKFGKIELYDLSLDPLEKNNLANTETEKLKFMLNELKKESEGELLPDPVGTYTKKNNGPPDGYVFPKYWGEKPQIAMLQHSASSKKITKILSAKEALGYPKNWKPK